MIAIDGFAASGKGTLGRALAQHLGFAFLDTGAIYRLAALKAIEQGITDHDPGRAARIARDLKKNFILSETLSPLIRTTQVGQMSSRLSALPDVRSELLDLQRNFAKNPPNLETGDPARGAVLDGRDIGTVVCPDADLKFFITASPEIRAQRRFKELQNRGFTDTYDAVLAEMRERDARDAGRAIAQTKPAKDAIVLDTSALKEGEVLELAISHLP